MFLAKRRVVKMKDEKVHCEARRKAAAILIQSHYRGWKTRREFKKLLEEQRLEEEQSRREFAACKIQSYFRMLLARKALEKKKEEKLRLEKAREAAATVIQSRYRGWVARRNYKQLLEKRRLEQERMKRESAACKIQKAYRAHLLRRKSREERREQWRRIENAVIGIQKYARGMLARRRVAELIAFRMDYLHKVVVIQNYVRGFLARRRFKKMLEERQRQTMGNDGNFDATQALPSSPPAENVSSDDKFCIDMERLRRLKRNVRENERMQKYYSSLLEACERKLSEEDSSSNPEEIAVDQPSTSNGTYYQPTLADQITAATKIQAWFRGCLTRSHLSEHLHRRRSFMRNYLGNVAAEQPRDVVNSDVLDALPVHAKIHDAVEMLFDQRMYITKVGAYILNRLTSLSPHLCAYFVVDAQGLAAILDFLDQQHIGRGPATANIFLIIADVFLRIIECREPTVVAEVNARLEDCVGRALHVFHAFYCYPRLVCTFGKAILAMYQRPNAEQYFGKATFYLRYAQKRFASIPETDPRRAVLEELTSQILNS
ncbi:hypothetical protein OESDEN_11573 [Oesophagostomum dentatum]|uniref:Uncharacterized protein n=1 Tax=Oesophagostomum dentatum TaxID=61180 RepID=A0A0B1SXN5_OESDE|nr:hypothetical protein OESDEN_11573 [Oesophagostomum dentatum]